MPGPEKSDLRFLLKVIDALLRDDHSTKDQLGAIRKAIAEQVPPEDVP